MSCVPLSVCPHSVGLCTRACLSLQHRSGCQPPTNELGYKCALKVTQVLTVIKSDLTLSLLTSLDEYRIMHLKTQTVLIAYQNVISEF